MEREEGREGAYGGDRSAVGEAVPRSHRALPERPLRGTGRCRHRPLRSACGKRNNPRRHRRGAHRASAGLAAFEYLRRTHWGAMRASMKVQSGSFTHISSASDFVSV